MMKYLLFYGVVLVMIFSYRTIENGSIAVYAQAAATPTPVYDPLAEPFLPENPSDYELGRNWYWHNCMTCHGDVGQGLTDEFRAIWPEDHQNCWDYGCHGGRRDDEGFPIPTVVPALVNEQKLEKFPSQQALFEFLKNTHPPQDPGGLEDEQYQVIVKFVFSMNDRPLDEPTPVPATLQAPIATPALELPSEKVSSSPPPLMIYIGLGIILVFAVMWGIKNKLPRP